jgi:peptide/nickel transport system permease protein
MSAATPPIVVPHRAAGSLRQSRLLATLRGRPALLVSLILLVLLLLAVFLPGVYSSQPTTGLFMRQALEAPSLAHPFGTDEAGRDVFSRVMHGTRYSLGMAFLIVVTGAIFGTAYGAVAGVVGGRVSEVMMRVVDIFLAFPAFVLAMAVAAAVGRGISSVIIALAIIWWPSYARLIRGMVLGLRENVWVEAAQSLGASRSRIIVRHILPFTTAELNVRFTVDIGYALVAVTSLSFIGLGAQRPTPEWGVLIADGRQYVTSAWWYPIFPGIAIYVSTLVFSLLGDALGEGSKSSRRR